MKNIKYLFLLLIYIVAFQSCNNKSDVGDDEFIIEGRFLHSRGNPIYIDVIHIENFEKIDSLKLDEDGNFSFRYKTDQPLFLRLSTDENNFITLIAEPKEKITLSGDIKALAETYSVSGSTASELICEYNEFTRLQYKKLDTIFNLWEQNKYSENKLLLRDSIDSLVINIENKQLDFVKNITKSNMNSLGTLFIICQKFGRKPVLDEIKNFNIYSSLAQNLIGKYPTNEHVNHLNARVNKIKIAQKEEAEIKARLNIGKQIPDFNLADIDGNDFRLSSLRGNTILLHFWGSWSTESIQQLNTIRNFNKKYSPKGLKTVSISFDFDEQAWKDAVKKEKMAWANICDFKYEASPIARQYNVKQIPFIFLIDKNGIIITKSSSIDSIGQNLHELYH